jgi:hypothetical protein
LATFTQLVPHIVRSAAQLVEQAPREQTVPGGQTLPQAPQFMPSLKTSAQPLGQAFNPPAHTQTPPAHPCPTPQTFPQAPQLLGSFMVSAPHPGGGWGPTLGDSLEHAPTLNTDAASSHARKTRKPTRFILYPPEVMLEAYPEWSPSSRGEGNVRPWFKGAARCEQDRFQNESVAASPW